MSRVARLPSIRNRTKRGLKTSETITSHDKPDLSYASDTENRSVNANKSTPEKKKRVSPVQRPSRKRILPSVSDDSVDNKKQKVSENNLERPTTEEHVERDVTDEHCYDISITKPKRIILNAEEQKQRRDKQMQYLQRFVNISKSYSQYLQSKIAKRTPSTSADSDSEDEFAPKKCNPNALKYFQGTLRPYQVEGVIWLSVLYENSINGILGDDMGLGKTIQVIALFAYLYERNIPGPFLIVAPLSTIGNWMAEFKRFAPKIPCIHFQSNWSKAEQTKFIKKQYQLEGKWVKSVIICSYQTPIRTSCHLRDYKWQYIVVDEGQRLKNANSKLSQELRGFLTTNKLLLTGTPLQNDIGELWALFSFLMPDLFMDMEDFSTLFDLEELRDTRKLLQNEAETEMISKIHKVLVPFMLRREKKLVLHDLVPKREMIIYCSLTPLQKYLYRAILDKDSWALFMQKKPLEKEKLVEAPKGKRQCVAKIKTYAQEKFDLSEVDYFTTKEVTSTSYNTASVLHYNTHVPLKIPDRPYMIRLTMANPMMMLKKAVNHPYLIWTPVVVEENRNELYVSKDMVKLSGKLLVLDAMLPKLKAGGHKILLFSTLTMMLDLVEELLIMRNYTYRRLDGSLDLDSRNDNINDFKSDDVFVFLLSTRAGGLGLNLTSADTVIFIDKDWNPMVDSQAQDRCHRIGQTKPVMIYSLVTKGTIDEIILNRGEVKKRLEKMVIKEGQFKGKQLDDADLKSLKDLLDEEETTVKINPNGFYYTEEEFDKILDRSDLIKEMKEKSPKKQ
ncbi:lymphocyte-specific helicase-like [Tribolium madens]|uniref:lymphocyte-specific helicase-like n=1 Tax=Tribolium madens TaxID=41895 RepID=UPI001CF73192|nr:lymphocyte-specific helicase-like [Tribolium madens]XP_044257262.1 lymphocyte-specific helicase-like [Tribolium madens]